MSIISLQEIMLVLLAAIVIVAYHAYLYTKVRRDPLTTAVGITNHARRMWVRVSLETSVTSSRYRRCAIK